MKNSYSSLELSPSNKRLDNTDISVSLPRSIFDAINLELKKGTVKIDGDRNKLKELLSIQVVFKLTFNIIIPNKQ